MVKWREKREWRGTKKNENKKKNAAAKKKKKLFSLSLSLFCFFSLLNLRLSVRSRDGTRPISAQARRQRAESATGKEELVLKKKRAIY